MNLIIQWLLRMERKIKIQIMEWRLWILSGMCIIFIVLEFQINVLVIILHILVRITIFIQRQYLFFLVLQSVFFFLFKSIFLQYIYSFIFLYSFYIINQIYIIIFNLYTYFSLNHMNIYILIIILQISLNLVHTRNQKYKPFNVKGNYLWSAAINLAWSQIKKNIVHNAIKLNTNDHQILSKLQSFNHPPIFDDDIDKKCYYSKATISETTNIKKQNKTIIKDDILSTSIGKIQINHNGKKIIGQSLFCKKGSYFNQFEVISRPFQTKMIKFFEYDQKKSNRYKFLSNQYENQHNFRIQIKIPNQNIQIFFIKSTKNYQIQEVAYIIQKSIDGSPLLSSDHCLIPFLQIDEYKQYKQFVNLEILNEGFKDSRINLMIETIKLSINSGNKQKEESRKQIGRKMYLDRPFWIIMRYKKRNPYFIGKINNI